MWCTNRLCPQRTLLYHFPPVTHVNQITELRPQGTGKRKTLIRLQSRPHPPASQRADADTERTSYLSWSDSPCGLASVGGSDLKASPIELIRHLILVVKQGRLLRGSADDSDTQVMLLLTESSLCS